MVCLDDRAVHAWVRGTLDADVGIVRQHLDQCDSCRDLVTNIVETQWIGQSVGRYKIVEPIGGGAMGEVYRAHDPDLGRDVAIKLVRAGGSERRLLREAQAMARLTHANVIRVYDVGTFADKVFLAMELVTGSTLASWFNAQRGWRAVVTMMRQAGRGLFAAHEAGLVHGDFKPENVLVADDGRVLVTDFGLARSGATTEAPARSDNGALTQTMTRGSAGTPAYMAPEQFDEGAIATPASDQFSFCVTLYEGLFGARPFVGNDLVELYEALSAGKLAIPARPRVPTRVARTLRRGLATNANDRFPSLAELLDELDAASRRRNRSIALAVAGVGAAIAGTLWVTSARDNACEDGASQFAGAWDNTVRARLRAAFDASRLPYATTSFATVSAVLDRYSKEWIETYGETCAATHVRNEQSEALLDVRMQCLRQRRQQVTALVDALVGGGAPAIRDSVAAVSGLSPLRACADVASLQEVARLPVDPKRRKQVEAVGTELARCRALLATGNYRPAHECATAAAKAASDAGYGPTVAEAELVSGMASSRLYAWDDADASFTRALLAAETSRDSRTRAQAQVWLVAAAGERTDFGQGHKRIDHASAIIKGLGDDKKLTSDLAYHKGMLLMREGKLDAAAESLTQAAALREQLFGAKDARIAEPLGALAAVQVTRKQYDEAQNVLDRALAIQSATLGDKHPNVAKTLHLVAQLQMRMGKLDAALASQRRSYDLLVAAYGENHRDVALSLGAAAQAYIYAGKYAEAIPYAKRSAELTEKVAGAEHPDTATALVTYASTLSRANKTAEAFAANERALAIRMKALGPNHLHTTQSQVNVAMGMRLQKRCGEALPLLESALATRTKQLPAEHPDILKVLLSIGDCHVDLGQAKDAIAPLERVLAGLTKVPRRSADDRVTFATTQFALARALWDSGGSRARATDLVRAANAEFVALKDDRAKGQEIWAKQHHVKL